MMAEQKNSHITTEREKASVPVSEKYMLTIKEAAEYFSIGTKKMRWLAEDNLGRFAVYSGNRYLTYAQNLKSLLRNLLRYKAFLFAKSS